MIATSTVTHEHHARLQPHVDELAVTAAMVGTGRDVELRQRLDADCAFLTEMLAPHMEAAERALFPELERLMQNRHSMTPLRREHDAIRALIAGLDRDRTSLGSGPTPMATSIRLRRALYQLHAVLKIHLAEEQLYADIAEHGMSAEAEATLAEAMAHHLPATA